MAYNARNGFWSCRDSRKCENRPYGWQPRAVFLTRKVLAVPPKDSRRRAALSAGHYSAFRASMAGGHITVDRAVARAFGGIVEAAFFHELAWRSDIPQITDDDGWIDVTAAELEESSTLTRRQQERVRKALRDLGVIEERRIGIPAQLYYRIDWGRAEDLVAAEGATRRDIRMHQTEDPDAPNGATRRTYEVKPDAPNGATLRGVKNSEQREKNAGRIDGKEKRSPVTLTELHQLDPVADRAVILRSKIRPEPPASASPSTYVAWEDVAAEWDRRRR